MKIINSLDEINDKGKVLLYFTAPYCVPCKTLGPVLEEAEKNHSNTLFLKIDTVQTPKIAQRYRVMSVPTLIVLENNNIIDKKISPSLSVVEDLLEDL